MSTQKMFCCKINVLLNVANDNITIHDINIAKIVIINGLKIL